MVSVLNAVGTDASCVGVSHVVHFDTSHNH